MSAKIAALRRRQKQSCRSEAFMERMEKKERKERMER